MPVAKAPKSHKLVDESNVPKWVLDTAKVAVKTKRLPKPGRPLMANREALYHIAKTTGEDWLDHSGRTKWDGYELLTSEPYRERLTPEALRQLERFVELIGGGYLISSNSEHLPGRTVLIVIAQSQAVIDRLRAAMPPDEIIR